MSDTRRLVIGRYGLVRVLGEGGFGRVWQARDEMLRVDVVVKEVRISPAAEPDERTRLLAYAAREARHAAQLRGHPNIVTVYDVAIEDGRPWIVMEKIDGGSLAERLRRGPLPVARAVAVAGCLLKALDAAHRAGVVHRDIKPGNVMLAGDGRVLLTDFGIATHSADTRLTMDGSVLGSLEYMAPERFNGAAGAPASDMFSLGATLYEAVEGSSPFRRNSPAATLAAVTSQDPPPPTRAGTLAPLISALLSKDPAARPSIPAALDLLRKPVRNAPKPGHVSRAETVKTYEATREVANRIQATVAKAPSSFAEARAHGDGDVMVGLLRMTVAKAEKKDNKFTQAAAWKMLAEAYVKANRPTSARTAFGRARDLYNTLDSTKAARECQAAIDAL